MVLDDAPERLAGQGRTALGHEERLLRGRRPPPAHLAAPALDADLRRAAERDDAALLALAEGLHEARLEVHVPEAEPDEFGDPQSGGVHRVEHRRVPEAEGRRVVGGCEQGEDLIRADGLRQRAPRAGPIDELGRVACDEPLREQPLVETSDRREHARL